MSAWSVDSCCKWPLADMASILLPEKVKAASLSQLWPENGCQECS